MTLKDAVFSGSREQVIPEEAFLSVLEEAATGLLGVRNQVRTGAGREWSRHFVSLLIREAHGLRTVLNDFDASENRTYSYFMELVAGIRGFGHVIYTLKHLRERYLRSTFRPGPDEQDGFLDETSATLVWCGDTMRSLFSALVEECDSLGLRLAEPEPGSVDEAGPGLDVRQHLPHNLDEEELAEEGEKVAQVASSFLRFTDAMKALPLNGCESYSQLKEFVRGQLDEEHARSLESRVHAIQSRYDTYVQFTPSETKDPDLRGLRVLISLILHLLEVTTHLVHFYERHENDIRSEVTKERVARIVDKKAVLGHAVNYAFRNARRLALEGEKISQRLIPEYTSIQEVTFRIPDHVRLHIRPAALIAAIANFHGTPIRMRMGGGECDASSVTDVIFLAGTNIDAGEVTFLGDEKPLADLKVLFGIGLEDSGRTDLEAALPYLKARR